jgi:hypothetical protein
MGEHPRRIAGLVLDLELPADVPPEARAQLQHLVDGFPVPQTLRQAPRLDIEVT